MSDLSERLKRLAALNRGPLAHTPPAAEGAVEDLRRKLRKRAAPPPAEPRPGPAPIVYRRDLPRAEPRPVRRPSVPGRPVVLEEAVPGREVEVPGRGRAYLIEGPVEALESSVPALSARFHERLQAAQSEVRSRLAAFCDRADLCAEDLLFLDLETTGLSNSPLFLVGMMFCEGGQLVIRQCLARDYSEEAAATALCLDQLATRRLLVSFNGKSFDLPYVRTRAAANGLRLAREPAHLDLLHESRRAWGYRLPDCKLRTLERYICGRSREDDIPGAEIPDAYHDFVRTSDATLMVQVLRHNLLDLATLAELLLKLPWYGHEGVSG